MIATKIIYVIIIIGAVLFMGTETDILNTLLFIMSDTAITATVGAVAVVVVGMIAAIPPSILAFASLRQSKLNAKTAEATAALNTTALANSVAKTDMLTERVIEVHTLTNGNLSKVTTQLEVANSKLEGFAKAQAVSDQRFVDLQKQVAALSGEHPLAPQPIKA